MILSATLCRSRVVRLLLRIRRAGRGGNLATWLSLGQAKKSWGYGLWIWLGGAEVCWSTPSNQNCGQQKNLPLPNEVDEFGGWTLPIYQCNFGHTAEKPTYLYIVGVPPESMPPMPIFPRKEACIIGSHGRRSDGTRMQPSDYGYRKPCFRPDREHTPLKLAEWLVDVARLCEPQSCH